MKYKLLCQAVLITSFFIGSIVEAHAQPVKMKPVLHGLVDMGNIKSYQKRTGVPDNSLTAISAYKPLFSGIVINVFWRQLQPNGPNELDLSSINSVLTAIENYNKTVPQDRELKVKLRIWAGPQAPNWAKKLAGGPIPINNTSRLGKHTQETIGVFWSHPYMKAWRHLQNWLAKRYDTNPLISEVAVTSCSTETDEPFIIWSQPNTIAVLRQHGYTDKARAACLVGAVRDYQAWKHTWIDYTFNPFSNLDSGQAHLSYNVTFHAMEVCARSGHCVLSNHNLDVKPGKIVVPVYQKILQIINSEPKGSVYVDFQTVSPTRLGPRSHWLLALKSGRYKYHAQSVELWPVGKGFFSPHPFPKSLIKQYAEIFNK